MDGIGIPEVGWAHAAPHVRPLALPRSRIHALALTAILVSAGWLRFSGLFEASIRFDDEAAYALDARLWHRCTPSLQLPAGPAIDQPPVSLFWQANM